MQSTIDKEFLTLRREIKYVVPIEKAIDIRSHLDSVLQRDKYCDSGSYSVRSLYFESINDTDFSEKVDGIDIRKKIRLRIYNCDTSLCKLELKEKNGDLQRKHSFIISAHDAKELIYENYSVLKNYFHNTRTSIDTYAIMLQECYRPVVQIEYDRIAYIYPMHDTRITLDMNIRSSEANMDVFAPKIQYTPIMPDSVVLEIKYNDRLMGFISDILNPFDLTQGSYSKYCVGRKVYYDFIW